MLKKIWFLIGFAVAVFGCTICYGQTIDGELRGVVKDKTGAIIPGATVKATNKGTGASRETISENDGSYRITNLAVGRYLLEVVMQGFRRFTQDGVEIKLNQITNVFPVLEVGDIATTVEVAGAGELVQTSTYQLGNTYDAKKIIELPIISQDPDSIYNVALLEPGTSSRSGGVLGFGPSIGGTRTRFNNFNYDGVENNDVAVTGPQLPIIQEAVADFSILQNQFSAEHGHSAGGQFNVITKQGTNDIHGSAWWFTQNRILNALNLPQKRSLCSSNPGPDCRTRSPRFDQNRLGGSIGGPVIKDKLFYFGTYEFRNRGREGSANTFLAPTDAGFATLAGIPGVSPFVLDLLRNNVPRPASPTSANRFPTVALDLNDPQSPRIPIPVGPVTSFIPDFFSDHQFQVNVDHNWGTTDQFHYRFNYLRDRALLAGNPIPRFNASRAEDHKFFSATNIHTFSPRVVNEARLSYRRRLQDFPLNDPAIANFPNIEDSQTGIMIGPNSNLPQGAFSNIYQMNDNVSYNLGKHNFRFGIDHRRLITSNQFLPRGRGDYTYTTFERLVRDQQPEFALRGVGIATFTGNQWQLFWFAQDDVKVLPNLTLNLGIRHEYVSLARDAALQELNHIADVPGVIEFNKPKTYKKAWAPRFGFAWDPWSNGKTSVRGGFGVSYDVIFQNLILLQLPPQFQQESGVNVPGVPPTNFLQNGGIPPTPIPPTTQQGARAGTQSFITDQIPPYVMNWSLGVQHELFPSWSVEVRYIGTRGVRLPIQFRRNSGIPPNFFLPTFMSAGDVPPAAVLDTLPTQAQFLSAATRPLAPFGFLGFVTAFEPAGNSIYHGGAFKLTHRFERGLYMSASYTFSRAIDDSTNELFSSRVNPRRPQNPFNLRDERGLSALDHTHHLALAYQWEPQFFKSLSGWTKWVLDGWQLNGVTRFETGQPWTPLSRVNSLGTGDIDTTRTILNPRGRPGTGSGVTPVRNRSGDIVGYLANNPNAQYIQAGIGARPTAGRNTLRAPGINIWNLSVIKNIRVQEERRVQFWAEFYNLFNHQQFTLTRVDPDPLTGSIDPTNSSFAAVSGSNFNDYTIGNGGSRRIQLGLKFVF